MPVLPAIKSAILRCTGVVVEGVFSSTDQIAIEMADLANDVATDIARGHDWRALTKIASITGAAAFNYPLPDDYDRMTLSSEVDDANSWFWGYEPFVAVNDWLRFRSGTYSIVSPGGWIIIGGEIQFFPAPNGEAQYPYISNEWARNEIGDPINAFSLDTDNFILDDRLLTLGLIWRWRAMKGLDYSEDLVNYETEFARSQARDKGSRLLRTPVNRLVGARLAYSGRPLG